MLAAVFKRCRFLAGLFIKLPLFTFSLFFIVGVVFAGSLGFVKASHILILLPFLFLLRKSKAVFTFCLVLFSLFCGAFRANYVESAYKSSWAKSLWGEEIELKGTIVREPVLKGNEYQYILKLDCESGEDVSLCRRNFGYVLVELSRFIEFSYGDYLNIYGNVEEPPEFEDFSYKEYLKTQQIFAVVENAGAGKIGERGNFLFRKLYDFKHFLAGNIREMLPEPHGSLLLGILLGIKSGMPKSFAENLSRTGTTHIIAVSGYNVTIVLASLAPLQKVLGRKRLFWFSVALLFLFIAIVGFENAPAMRAGIMGFIYLFANFSGRKGDIKTIFTFTAALMIFSNPFIISSISFQLSFVSTLGVIVLSRKIEVFSNRLPDLIGSELSPSLSAIFSTSPITILNFGKISVVSLATNILVLPAVPVIMGVGAILAFLSLVPNFLSKIISFFTFQMLDYVIRVIEWFGRLDFAVLDVPKSIYIPIFVYSLILFVFLETAYRKYMTRYL